MGHTKDEDTYTYYASGSYSSLNKIYTNPYISILYLDVFTNPYDYKVFVNK